MKLYKKNNLALFGGKPVIAKMNRYLTLDSKEVNAATRVIKSGKLSGFLGSNSAEFLGGKEVRELESNWQKYFKVRYAVSMNSATSCLYASIAALDVSKGDEVIVTPTTMTATVTGIVLFGGTPVFVDICPKTFCINPLLIEEKITSKTKAIVATNIYGFSANWIMINKIAKRYGLKTIEDAAQSYGVKYNGKNSGTLADIGIYSLNRHKHIQTGEGGVCVTDDKKLAERLRLIRNHGEAVVTQKKNFNLSNIIGFNFRMTEIEAAIAKEQLKKLKKLVEVRKKISKMIIEVFTEFEGIENPYNYNNICKSKNCCKENFNNGDHSYYYICFYFNGNKIKLSRSLFVKALQAEGVPVYEGGYYPVYYQAMFQKKIALGKKGFPFKKKINYKKGLCPMAEYAWSNIFYFSIQNYHPTKQQINKIKLAILKIFNNKEFLQ